MKPGTGQRWVLAALIGFFAVNIGYIVVRRLSKQPIEAPLRRDDVRSDRFHLEGFDYTHSERGKQLFRFRADEMIHRMRKLGPLTIAAMKVIEIKGMHIEIYDFDDDEEDDRSDTLLNYSRRPLAEILEDIAPLKEMGFISRILAQGITVEVWNKDDAGLLLTADRFVVGFKEPAMTFSGNVSLVAFDDELLSERLVWRPGTGSFRAEGGYILRKADGFQWRGDAGSFSFGNGGELRLDSAG